MIRVPSKVEFNFWQVFSPSFDFKFNSSPPPRYHIYTNIVILCMQRVHYFRPLAWEFFHFFESSKCAQLEMQGNEISLAHTQNAVHSIRFEIGGYISTTPAGEWLDCDLSMVTATWVWWNIPGDSQQNTHQSSSGCRVLMKALKMGIQFLDQFKKDAPKNLICTKSD